MSRFGVMLLVVTFALCAEIVMAEEKEKKEVLPEVQMFVPGFEVRKLPVKITNLVNIEYDQEGRLYGAGYDGRISQLIDSDGDGLEDKVHFIWDQTSADYPLGFLVHRGAVYVLFKSELVRFVDSNGDGVPDLREVVLKDWDDEKLLEHPLILKRRVDFAMGLAIGPDESIYIGMGNAAYNNSYMIDKEGKLGEKNKSYYQKSNIRGCVLKFSADGKKKEQWLTGTRYLMCMQFNRMGDLFATDQEGATWMPNGNPFDELLHLQSGRHYGFPPRHPDYLPEVIDEPSVYDYAPQHQSLCGFRFNEKQVFGPARWKDDAILAGYTRGKIYRTKLVKTETGYLAQNQLIAGMQSLAADVTISPKGELVVTSHTGKPDWGTGPSGEGLLYKIRYLNDETPSPVAIWSGGSGEFRIAFDKALDPKKLKLLAEQIQIKAGKYVFAGDRYETIRPGYEVVKQQVAAEKAVVPVLSTGLTGDGRTLIINTHATTKAVNYGLTLPAFNKEVSALGSVIQNPVIELQADLHGVEAIWTSLDKKEIRCWQPHVDLGICEQLMEGSMEHQQFQAAMKKPGALKMRGQLDLWEMLHPKIQPNAKLDYERSPEDVQVILSAAVPFAVTFGADKYESKIQDGKNQVTLKHLSREDRWIPFEISLETQGTAPGVEICWSTAMDERLRVFPLNRFLVPWAVSYQDKSTFNIDRSKLPELAGGDRERGHKLFMGEANCSKCHQLRGEGTKIGPDLANLIHRDYESVMRDIKTPNAAINPDYLSYKVLLNDGRIFTGLVNSETKDTLQLADNAGKLIDIKREEIAEVMVSNTSVMPEDLLKKLSVEDVRDLMMFLLVEPEKK